MPADAGGRIVRTAVEPLAGLARLCLLLAVGLGSLSAGRHGRRLPGCGHELIVAVWGNRVSQNRRALVADCGPLDARNG